MFDTLAQDLKFALRQLLKKPAFTLVTVVVLALGIGANAAIFSMVRGVILRDLPYRAGEELVLLRHGMPGAGAEDIGFSPTEMRDYRDQAESFEGVVEYHSMFFTLLGREQPSRVQTGVVSANYFDVLGVGAEVGRTFDEDDEAAGSEAVLVLGHGYWQREFGADPGIVGEQFEMNNRVHTVIGVLPPLPGYPDDNDVYMPTSHCPFRSREPVETTRRARMLSSVFARLGSGVTLEEAQADVAVIAGRLREDHPDAYPAAGNYQAEVVSLREELIGEARPRLWILFGTALLVLLITCANLANLTLARLLPREQELAIRATFGASRGRLTRLLLIESTTLALVGGALGLFLAVAVLDLLAAFAGRFTNLAGEIRIDGAVLLFVFVISVATGIAVGLLPAWYSRRNLLPALHEGSARSGGGREFRRWRSALIVAELAISFMLLVGAGLMVRSLSELESVDGGFDAEKVLTAQVSLNWTQYSNPQSRIAFFSQLLDKVEALPGVRSVALGVNFPLDQADVFSNHFMVEGTGMPEDGAPPQADFRIASGDYFDTLGIPFFAGRDFTASDDAQAPPVAIVNQALVRRYLGDDDPLGRRISMDGGRSWIEIVGVVGDVRQKGLDHQASEEVYIPFAQRPLIEMNLLARTEGDPRQLALPIRDAVDSIDPEQPVSNVQTLDEVRRDSLASPRLTALLLGLFAGLALVISITGLWGLLAFAVGQETREIGIRMALGAERGEVLWGVLRRALVLVAIGLVLGAFGAFGLSRFLESLLFGVEPLDLVTFLAVPLVLASIALAAAFVPARRATRVDPVTALRTE